MFFFVTLNLQTFFFLPTRTHFLGHYPLINKCGVDYYSVNFEHAPAFFTGENGKKLRNCECMFSSCYAKKRKWVLLLEMKYSKEKNIKENAENALDVLEKTRDLLMERGVLNDEEYRVYFDISFPEHTSREPFHSFLFTPNDLLYYKERQNVTLTCFPHFSKIISSTSLAVH